MNVIVTGGEGFIGRKLVSKLKIHGYNVLSLDKSSTADIVTDLSSESDIISKTGIQADYIFHLAAQSGGYYSLKDPYTDCKWNCLGTINVIKLAQALKVKKLIYISSMAVYGNQKSVDEYASLANPISFYGVSKFTGELYTKLVYEHSNIPYTIFRLFATYGSGQDLNNKHQGILSIYLDQALNNNTVEITGNKDRVRELVHVNDVINALMLSFNKETDNKIYNVSNPEYLTPEIIINKISKVLDKPLSITELAGYAGDQTYITGKVDRLKNLGWYPKYNIEQGIREFVNNI